MAEKTKTKRGRVDWEACERDYRSGTFSNRQLAEQHGCTEGAIRDRVKRYGWTKDLSEAVRQATATKLLRAELRETNAEEDAALIEEAATVRTAVVQSHRKDIAASRSMVAVLLDELRTSTAQHDDIEAAIEDETKDDPNSQRRNLMLKAVSLPSRAGVIKDLSAAMKNLVGLERQAFSLDKDGDGDSRPTTIIVGTGIDRG